MLKIFFLLPFKICLFRIGLVSAIELLTSADGLLPGADPETLNESIHTLAMLLYRLSVNDLENFDLFDAVLKGDIEGIQIVP